MKKVLRYIEPFFRRCFILLILLAFSLDMSDALLSSLNNLCTLFFVNISLDLLMLPPSLNFLCELAARREFAGSFCAPLGHFERIEMKADRRALCLRSPSVKRWRLRMTYCLNISH